MYIIEGLLCFIVLAFYGNCQYQPAVRKNCNWEEGCFLQVEKQPYHWVSQILITILRNDIFWFD